MEQQEQQPGTYHQFFPPDDAEQQYPMPPPTNFSYLVPHTPVPIVPSQMGLELTSMGYQQHAHAHSGTATPVTTEHGDSSFERAHPPPLDAPSDDSAGAASYHSSGPASPASLRGGALALGAHPLRYNPMARPTPSPAGSMSSSSGRRRSVDSHSGGAFSDDDAPPPGPPPRAIGSLGESFTMSRKEQTRRQRIEAEQKRRDELRDGYTRLREVLPSASQKGSKVALLDRATTYIQELDRTTAQMSARLLEMENEMARLRKLNEIISMNLSGAALHSGSVTPSQEQSLQAEMRDLHVADSPASAGIDPADIMPPHPKEEVLSPASSA